MSNASNSDPSPPEDSSQLDAAEIRRELLRGREFTLADVIATEGGSFMQGESPVPKLVQVQTQIKTFISRNLTDIPGALQAVLQRWVEEDIARVSQHLDAPLHALSGLLDSIIENPPILHELVHQVDMQWGQMNDERPHFQRPGQAPHPEDEYTHDSVYQQLVELNHRLQSRLDEQENSG